MNAYYQCAAKKQTHCNGTATVSSITYEAEDKTPKFRYVLSKWTSCDQHNHEGDPGKIIADRIMMEMVKKVEVIFHIIIILLIYNYGENNYVYFYFRTVLHFLFQGFTTRFYLNMRENMEARTYGMKLFYLLDKKLPACKNCIGLDKISWVQFLKIGMISILRQC